MRWFVEISPLGQKAGPSTTLCVEAPQWQPALQKARAMRGDDGAMSNFSIELLDDGFRAIDPATRLRYVVKRAPDDAALSATPTPAPAAPVAEKPAAEKPAVAVPAPHVPEVKKRPPAQTVAFVSPGAAVVKEPAPAPVPAPEPASAPPKRPPAQTVAFVSPGAAVVKEAAPAPKPAPEPPSAKPAAVSVPRPPAAAEPARETVPSFVLVGSREDNPTDSSPLTYREFVYAVAQGTNEEDARRLILDRFETVLASIDHVRAGKLINLAVFDHVFHQRPQRRPLVTLTWKDWKPDPPDIRFPDRDGAASSGRLMTPMGTPVVRPPAEDGKPASMASHGGAASGPTPRAPSEPAPTHRAAEPASRIEPAAAKVEPTPKAEPAAPKSEPKPEPAAVKAEPAPKAEPAAPKPTGTLGSAKSAAQPKPEPAVAVVAAPQPAVPAPKPIKVPEPPAAFPAPKAVEASAGTDSARRLVKPIIAIEPAKEVTPAAPESGVVPTLASPGQDGHAAREPAPPREPEPAPRASEPSPLKAAAPAAVPASSPSKPAAPRKRLTGDDLLVELFEAFGDLQFLRDALEGAEFVLALTLEHVPSEVGLISLFDMNTREFVVVRQSGGQHTALCARLPERAPLASKAMRGRRAVVVSDPEGAEAAMDDRFRAIGVQIRSLITAPVELGGRYLGLIEVVNPLDGGVFNEGDGNALNYIGEQLAEFVAARGVIVDPELIRAPPKAPFDGAASAPKGRAAIPAQPAVPSSKRGR